VHALRGIQMQVRTGEIFGLLGPNGCRQEHLVKIMMTVIRLKTCRRNDPRPSDRTQRDIDPRGLPARTPSLPPYLTGRQALEFFAALAKVKSPARKRRAAELLALVI